MTTLAIKKKTNIFSSDFKSSPFYDWWKEKSNSEKVKEDTGSFAKIESLFSFLQSKNCRIINKEEITDFFNNHIGIADYLYEAPQVIAKYFKDANLNLELVFDPEIENDDGELFLNIETDLEIKEARKKLNTIDKEWLIPVVGKNIAKFNVDIEFI